MYTNNKNKILLILAVSLTTTMVNAAELIHHFNSPAFSGIGWSSHVLTIQQMENNAVEKNQAQADALKAQALREAQNTPQARFIANLENRIYGQLAKQLTDSMFGEGATCTTSGVTCGTIPDLAGNSISWQLGAGSDSGMIVITIQNLSDSNQTTTMKVPAGTFRF